MNSYKIYEIKLESTKLSCPEVMNTNRVLKFKAISFLLSNYGIFNPSETCVVIINYANIASYYAHAQLVRNILLLRG